MQRPTISRRGIAAAALAGAAVLGASVVASAGAASAATNYAASATLTSAGPTIFSTAAIDQPVANLTLSELVAGGVPSGYVCLNPSGGSFADNGSQTPTVTATGGAVVATPTITSSGSISFDVTTPSTTAGTFTIANLYGTTTGSGRATVTVTDGDSSACGGVGNTLTSTVGAFALETSTQTTYGQTADATTAVEYGEEFACTGTSGTVAHTAVLATDVDPYDALSASTLEGALNAGLLITPPTSIDSNTATALRTDGVSTVYVVGGPDAITQADITSLESTPATQCTNGVEASTGSNIKVVGPIYGQTADATAAAIDTEANKIAAFTSDQPAMDLTGVSTSTYNDTTGNTSANGIAAGAGKTAIVVSDKDFQDSMSASGMAYADNLPVILTPGASLGPDATSELSSLGIKQAIVLGGQLSVQPAVVSTMMASGITVVRIAGEDGTDSAAMLAKFEDSQTANAGLGWVPNPAGSALLAQGASANDALGAAAISGTEHASIFLTESPTKGLGTYTTAVLGLAGSSTGLGSTSHSSMIDSLQVLGGPLAVPASQISAALVALG